MKTEQEKLELGIKTYVDNWFDGLIKSWKDAANKQALMNSYNYIAKQAVKAYQEKLTNEPYPSTEREKLIHFLTEIKKDKDSITIEQQVDTYILNN